MTTFGYRKKMLFPLTDRRVGEEEERYTYE